MKQTFLNSKVRILWCDLVCYCNFGALGVWDRSWAKGKITEFFFKQYQIYFLS